MDNLQYIYNLKTLLSNADVVVTGVKMTPLEVLGSNVVLAGGNNLFALPLETS